jgi:serine/threonine-protein kinase
MKQCPKCNQVYSDEIKFCRQDGTPLISDAPVKPTVALPSSSLSIKSTTPRLYSAPSIAVLPFANMSADAENEYFCDGLAEELLNALAKIDDLKVAARTSAFYFKGKNATANEIGQTLNVETVLEGSVRKSGKRLRITVQLISVADGYHLWSERYDREMKDVFEIQDEITLAVVDALKLKLLARENLKHDTVNPESYDEYLKGLYQYSKYNGESCMRAIEHFEKAIEKEPGYARAYAGKASCHHFLYYFGFVAHEKIINEWLNAVRTALELDEQVAEAHLSLANYYFYYERNWVLAEREFERAIELNPNSAEARHFYGLFLVSRERFDEGIRHGERALELDPLSLLVNLHVGWIYWFAQRYEDTLRQVERMIEIEPNFFGAYLLLGTVHSVRGNQEAAIEADEKALALGETQIVMSFLGSAYGLAGRREEALVIIDRLLTLRERHFTAAFNIARVYGGLSETDKTFEWLEKSLNERDGELVYLEVLSKVGRSLWGEEFFNDPRFKNLLQRIEFRS